MEEKFSDVVKKVCCNEDNSRRPLVIQMMISEIDRMNAQWEKFAEWARNTGHPRWCYSNDRVPGCCNCGLEESLESVSREYIPEPEEVEENENYGY